MSEHRVLALKYRPKTFGELIGQEAVSRTLSLALENNKLSHAYLFSGLRGSGKTSSARIFAKSLLCEKGITALPCETCDSCTQANEGRHIDIVEMDAASNRRIDDIRDLIEQTRYAPGSGRFKIFIIDEVHMLTKEAFNALLKTLEEPPSYIKFLLATTDPLKLPPTILSRTQHFRFKKIGFDDALKHLMFIVSKEGIEADSKALEMITRSGGGSLRDTLTLLEQAIIFGKGRVDLNATVEMLGVLDPAQIERYFELVFARDRDGAIAFIKEIETSDPEMVIDEMINFLTERLYKMSAPFTPSVIERFFRIGAEIKNLLFAGADGAFALALMTMRMIEALRPEAIDEAIRRLENDLETSPSGNATIASSAVSSATQIPPRKQATSDPFERLKRRVSDRSAALGEAFGRSVRFVSCDNGELRWISNPQPADEARLRSDFGVILELAREIFGNDVKIVKVNAAPETSETRAVSNKPPEAIGVSDAPSSIEAIASSNAATNTFSQESSPSAAPPPARADRAKAPDETDDDPASLLEQPLVQKAREIFVPTQIDIYAK
ncbi:MAG: DNA polymerase III subunit gamma/tau [Helicobacteraceae bacterium]|jgi:DNA polymerase-3 subunit gamma/tau|nr:DNA polymerase III subunit gamma/tau [Helicobacteraceae bacterium]